MLACALLPRFALVAALGSRRETLVRAVALAPEPGGPQVVGETSGAAEAFGIHAGMRLGEALARCPELGLVPPDSERAEDAWEGVLRRLEEIGAAVESPRPGEAFFAVEGLRGLWGGSIEGVLARARRAVGAGARLGAGPTRLCAHAAALRDRSRANGRGKRGRGAGGGTTIVPPGAARSFLVSLPVGVLRARLTGEWERATLPDALERLGVHTLGELAQLPDAAVADRFGRTGLRALEIARGADEELEPRRRHDDLTECLELPEAASGTQLERALELLVGRLLAHPARLGRSFRRLRISARLAGGGSWRTEAALRQASADAERLRLALAPRLGELPGPANSLALRALTLGPAAHDQPSLAHDESARRRQLLGDAVRQVRAAGGRDALLRVLDVDPDSRVPERRAMLTPFPEEPS